MAVPYSSIVVSSCILQLTRLCRLQVRSVPVTTRQIELSALNVREAKVQELKSVEASLRLDAIASAGFRTSRSKIVDLVKAGDIRCLPHLHACSMHEFVTTMSDQAAAVSNMQSEDVASTSRASRKQSSNFSLAQLAPTTPTAFPDCNLRMHMCIYSIS